MKPNYKRSNATMILHKAQQLSVRADRQTENASVYATNYIRINRAAVNELLRLEALHELEVFADGYDKGFETCRIAETVSIKAASNQELICGGLKP